MLYKKGLKVCNFIKKRIFLENVAEFLRKHILEKISEWLLLQKVLLRKLGKEKRRVNKCLKLKCYLCQKTIFVILQLLMYECFFLILRKNYVWLSRYLHFCAFGEHINFKICDVIVNVIAHYSYTFGSFFRILGTIKMKFGQIVQLMKNIPTRFYHYCEDQKLVSGSFMNLVKY